MSPDFNDAARPGIATRLHAVLDAMRPENFGGTIGPSTSVVAEVMAAMRSAPVYCMGTELLELAASDAGYDSVAALFAAGLGDRLPFPEVLVELFGERMRAQHMLVLLAEQKALVVTGSDPKTGAETTVESDFVAHVVTAGPAQLDGRTVLDVHFEPGTFIIEAGTPQRPCLVTTVIPDGPQLFDAAAKAIAASNVGLVKTAFKALLLAMAADGVVRRRIEPPAALNKARAKRGKAPIPACTVLRLSAGAAANGASRGVGRPVRLHLRAGHFRRQPHGRGSTERKLIFIRPVLIGYRPGNEAPRPIREVRL